MAVTKNWIVQLGVVVGTSIEEAKVWGTLILMELSELAQAEAYAKPYAATSE
jgi:hypothetical protein